MPYMQGAPVYGMPMPSQPPAGWMQQPQPNAQPYAPPPKVAMPAPPPQPQMQAQLTLPPPGFAQQPRPIVRAVAEDSPPPPPARLVLPSPEALGIPPVAAPAPVAVDWNQVHARFEQLGVVKLQRDRLPQGGYRVTLALPAHQVEATADTEAAAVLLAVQRAESLVAAPR